jgi:hypothetical protein
MHLPALAAAICHDERYKAVFVRLVSKHGIKMKAVVAVQRKLLELMYTLYKKQENMVKTILKTMRSNTLQKLFEKKQEAQNVAPCTGWYFTA